MADVTQSIDVRIKTAIDSANAETSLRSLRGALKDLQSLAEEAADSNTGAFEELEVAINRVEGRIGDASDRLRVMAGEPLEKVRNGISLFGEGIKNLDFTKATIGIDGLASGIKNMNVGDFKKGIESVTGSFINLGKALISNPIFLLTTAITLIITNFDKLVKVGGIVGDFFKGLNVIITAITDTVMNFINALGIVNTKQEDLKNSTQALQIAQNELKIAYLESEKAISKLLGTGTYYQDYSIQLTKIDEARKKVLKDLKDEIEKRPELEKIVNQKTLEEAVKFANFYKVLNEQQINTLKDFYLKRQELENNMDLFLVQSARNLKENTHKANLEKIEGYQNDYKRQTELLKENYKYESDLRKIENGNTLEDIKALGVARERKYKDIYDQENKNYYEQLNIKKKIQSEYDEAVKRASSETDKDIINDLGVQLDIYENIVRQAKTKMQVAEKTLKDQREAQSNTENKLRLEQENEEKVRKENHNKELLKINTQFKLNIAQDNQTYAKNDFDYQNKLLDSFYNNGIFTTEEYEKMRQTLLSQYNKEEEKRIISIYDLQIGLAVGNAKKIEFLEKQKQLALKNIKLEEEKSNKESNERILKNEENVAKEKERIAKEYIELNKQVQASDIQSSQNLININQIEMDLLNTKANKYRNVEEEKKTLIMENFANQGLFLQQQMAAELLANETNTINKEQRDFEIREFYAAKEKQLRKDTSEALIQTTEEELDRKANLYKAYIDMAINLDSFARDITRIGLSETRKETEKSARQRFVIQKIAGIASVGIDTAVGVIKAAAESPLTGGLPFSAFIIAQGAAAAAAIAAKQFSYSGGSEGGSAGSISAIAPNVGTPPTLNTSGSFNPSAFYGIGSQRTDMSTGNKMPIRAYVVETDITGTQKLVRTQAERATLSGR